MLRSRKPLKSFPLEKAPVPDSRQVFWTQCAKCGDTWVTKEVLNKGKCPVCGGTPKIQRQVS